MLVLGQEVGLLAGIEPRLALDALLQQLLALRAEAALQLDHEGQRLGGENGFEARLECAGDLYARHLRPTVRKRVVEGKSVAVRVDLGGSRVRKKKTRRDRTTEVSQ